MQENSVISSNRARVLLVEDSPDMVKVLTRTVNSITGLEVVSVADSASGAILYFKEHRPNILILDLNLASGDGLNVLQEVKRHQVPCLVIVFTALDTEPYRVSCMEAGAYRFFSKSREHPEMVRLLRHLGGDRSAQSATAVSHPATPTAASGAG